MLNSTYEVTLIHDDGSKKSYTLHNRDEVDKVEGGIQIRWHSSPSLSTFYPWHRVWEMSAREL